MAYEILHEYSLNMTSAYLVFPIIKQVLANGTDTPLIYVIYRAIKNRLCCPRPEKIGYQLAQNIHSGIFVLMLLFGSWMLLYTLTPNFTLSPMARSIAKLSTSPVDIQTFMFFTLLFIVQWRWRCSVLQFSSRDRSRAG